LPYPSPGLLLGVPALAEVQEGHVVRDPFDLVTAPFVVPARHESLAVAAGGHLVALAGALAEQVQGVDGAHGKRDGVGPGPFPVQKATAVPAEPPLGLLGRAVVLQRAAPGRGDGEDGRRLQPVGREEEASRLLSVLGALARPGLDRSAATHQ
jgi:hypothetical protein